MPKSPRDQFFEYLVEIDAIYAEYFRNRQDDIHSIIQCYGPFNEGKLLYFAYAELDPYIQRIVTEKHRELFGIKSSVETIA
jgi:hypothetical protein